METKNKWKVALFALLLAFLVALVVVLCLVVSKDLRAEQDITSEVKRAAIELVSADDGVTAEIEYLCTIPVDGVKGEVKLYILTVGKTKYILTANIVGNEICDLKFGGAYGGDNG